MTLKQLYDKLPPSQQSNIYVVNNGQMVVYYDGTTILTAYLDAQQKLIPADIATQNALNALG